MTEHLCKVVYDIILYRLSTKSIGNVSYIRKYGWKTYIMLDKTEILLKVALNTINLHLL